MEKASPVRGSWTARKRGTSFSPQILQEDVPVSLLSESTKLEADCMGLGGYLFVVVGDQFASARIENSEIAKTHFLQAEFNRSRQHTEPIGNAASEADGRSLCKILRRAR